MYNTVVCGCYIIQGRHISQQRAKLEQHALALRACKLEPKY